MSSHLPVNCVQQKSFLADGFGDIEKKYKEEAALIDCPYCHKIITSKVMFCFDCKINICAKCGENWIPHCLNRHHCKENKSQHKKNSEEFFSQFNTLKNDYKKYETEKIISEENVKKLKDFVENYQTERIVDKKLADACNFLEAFYGIDLFY